MRPILIGGCDRSGTTLLGSMLGNRQDAITIPESQFRLEVFADLAQRGKDPCSEEILDYFLRHWRFRLWNVEVDRENILGKNPCYRGAFEALIKAYAGSAGKPNPEIWVDHTPANARNATAQLEAFPDAKMIHLVRDGRAVVASVMKLDWGPNTIVNSTRWWIEMMSQGLAIETSRFASRVIRVRYEDVVRNPRFEIERICEFTGLDFRESMLTSGGFQVPDYTRRQHALVGGCPDPSRLNSWQRELSPREIEIFEALSNDLLPLLGYEKLCPYANRPCSREQTLYAVRELYRKWQNKIVRKRRIRAA